MRPALFLAAICGLAACSLSSPAPKVATSPGGGDIAVTALAAPTAAPDGAPSAAATNAAPDQAQVATSQTPHPVARPVASAVAGVPAPSPLAIAGSGDGAAASQARPATAATPHPQPRPAPPATVANSAPASTPPPPPKPKSTLQIRCEAAGGIWGQAGTSGVYICQTRTGDGGKICHRKSDCQGLCLAASGTCAPVTPLLGCNDVLDSQGRRSTLCLN